MAYSTTTALTMGPSSPASSTASILSSSPSCSSLSSSRSSCSSDGGSIASTSSVRLPRPNAHLAVLLDKKLWKEDANATHCDNFYCRVPFTVWERKHHCRKCGGIFCQPCSARSTPLLDASHLPFLHPPRDTPLQAFASPVSPLEDARVCDDCYDQIHGVRTPELSPLRPRPTLSRTQSLLASPIAARLSFSSVSSSRSPTSSAPQSAPSSPPARERSLLPPGGLSRTRPHSLRGAPRPVTRAATLPSKAKTEKEERSYGELDAYPLRRASLLCKAAGGGRWEPKPAVEDPALRVPIIGGKAPYELEMEREEAEERRRRSNPVIKDGDFQYRFPAMCEPEPVVLERPPIQFSTF
ncbi:FYVE zinc finger-domain-containing protein [Mycena filopes]|nr:FYVE zinc finger-domain-containing protein [Mycena filopes]